jgi:shikimate kinase
MTSALLTPAEFDQHRASGTLRLSFVGMSNAGKSYRSKTLEGAGFLWYQVDDVIQRNLGFKEMGEISSWLGYPTSPDYLKNEAAYLAHEDEATRHASMQTGGKNLVFDTTGSVVHLSPTTLDALHENCLVIHLDVGDDSLPELLETFFAEPKPVAWCGFFNQKIGEPEADALKRCYPALLAERLARYRALAHINIPARSLRDLSGEETLAYIRSCLP